MRARVSGTAAFAVIVLLSAVAPQCAGSAAAASVAAPPPAARLRAALRDHAHRARGRIRSAGAAVARRHDLCAARHRFSRHPDARRGRCAHRRHPRRQSHRPRSRQYDPGLWPGRHDAALSESPPDDMPPPYGTPPDFDAPRWRQARAGRDAAIARPAVRSARHDARDGDDVPPLPRPRPAELASRKTAGDDQARRNSAAAPDAKPDAKVRRQA